ncbi:hypothetical protein B484DRAFT_392910 [Ochromonadaceae sp. CCMP2298]|nr:hypothetical protein B484DRAFT_392910 [Ochromonadaceae sp. CCMP2298]
MEITRVEVAAVVVMAVVMTIVATTRVMVTVTQDVLYCVVCTSGAVEARRWMNSAAKPEYSGRMEAIAALDPIVLSDPRFLTALASDNAGFSRNLVCPKQGVMGNAAAVAAAVGAGGSGSSLTIGSSGGGVGVGMDVASSEACPVVLLSALAAPLQPEGSRLLRARVDHLLSRTYANLSGSILSVPSPDAMQGFVDLQKRLLRAPSKTKQQKGLYQKEVGNLGMSQKEVVAELYQMNMRQGLGTDAGAASDILQAALACSDPMQGLGRGMVLLSRLGLMDTMERLGGGGDDSSVKTEGTVKTETSWQEHGRSQRLFRPDGSWYQTRGLQNGQGDVPPEQMQGELRRIHQAIFGGAGAIDGPGPGGGPGAGAMGEGEGEGAGGGLGRQMGRVSEDALLCRDSVRAMKVAQLLAGSQQCVRRRMHPFGPTDARG